MGIKRKFQLKPKAGTHAIRVPGTMKDKVYKAGDFIVSERDLAAEMPNKFQLVDSHVNISATEGEVSSPSFPLKSEKAEDKSDKNVPESSAFDGINGKDVTYKFPDAAKRGLMVFEKSKWYTVVDAADGSLVCDKKLRKNQVQVNLDEYEDLEDDLDEPEDDDDSDDDDNDDSDDDDSDDDDSDDDDSDDDDAGDSDEPEDDDEDE